MPCNMNTYIISLADQKARREHILAQCAAFGLAPIVVDAVDLRQESEAHVCKLSDLPLHKKRKKQCWLSKGEVGCALSHHQVYQNMVANQDDYAMVVEDDALLLKNPNIIFNEATLQAIAKQYDFDVLIIGCVKTLKEQLPYYYRLMPLKKTCRSFLPPRNTDLRYTMATIYLRHSGLYH